MKLRLAIPLSSTRSSISFAGNRHRSVHVEDGWENLAVATAFYEAAANGSAVTPQQLPDAQE